jgi:lipid-binding SYLF domain-containing protein
MMIEGNVMKTFVTLLAVVLSVCAGTAVADDYSDTVDLFRNAGQSGAFFDASYGYAVFPTIAKGGLGIGAAHGSGQVFEQGKHVGDTKVTQVSVGLQAGGQAFSQIIFFQDKRAFDEFTSGNFAFDATVGAVAVTAAAGGKAGTTGGATGTASGGKKDAVTAGAWHKGMAVFTIAKGGLMYEATVGGQKFSYKKL